MNPGTSPDYQGVKDAGQLADALLDEERRNVLEKEDRKAGDLLA